ncbi:MAG: TM2 domain-containing protein [Synechococcales cyanobacterium RM1_1_8]|nr:TM2 domain-containing protein [Synechococcales cyanobacterium RM1_1_8]
MEQPQNRAGVPPINQPVGQSGNRTLNSYLFWLLFLMGFGGIHRIYNGKIGTGLLWFFTWGLFGIGQTVDLLLIPDMAEEQRLRLMAKSGLLRPGMGVGQVVATQTAVLTPEQRMVQLLEVARERGGRLTVPQAVIAMGLSFDEVEGLLLEMHRRGYAAMENEAETGVIVYEFLGL